MTAEDVARRAARLEALTLELMQEAATIRKGDDPLLYRERKAYIEGLGQALAGVETARVTLARAGQRMRGA